MKKLKKVLWIILILTPLILLAYWFLKAEKKEINLAMRDGVQLSTTLYIPKGIGTYPTVLVRTPYDKKNEYWMGQAFNLFRIAVVVQDVRGRFESEGVFYPFINERSDGLETLRWIRDQPWSNGVVGGYGGSYLGITQWAISDSLDYLNLLLTGANLYDFVYPEGLYSLQSAFTWGFGIADQNAIAGHPEKLDNSYKILPLSSADDATLMDIQFLNDWLLNENYNAYWEKINFRGISKAPILSVAGWYDIFLTAQIEDFQALDKGGDTPNRLIIGPFCHGTPGEAIDYGGEEKTGKPTLLFKYLKNSLKGKKGSLKSPFHDKKYNLFIMERNEYVGSDSWPPPESTLTPYYLGPSNYLSNVIYDQDGQLQYEYMPSDPYPSYGGTALGTGVGPARQNNNLNRSDQLAFTLDISEDPLVLLGPVSATLWLSSDVTCTDFMVQIQDVFPDGKIINIQDGGTHVAFQDQNPRRTEISVWATGYQINPGHQLRVIITSSLFPRYNRSLNNCEPIYGNTIMNSAIQKVYYGPDTPSAVYLPVYQLPEH